MNVGDVYLHRRFYADATTGTVHSKYLLVLAMTAEGDVIARVLTSRHAGMRPEQPPCHHGDPYPGFYLGAPCAPLTRKTWLDLRYLDDLDADRFQRLIRNRIAEPVAALPNDLVCAAMQCAAGATDTTRHQERHIRDALAFLR